MPCRPADGQPSSMSAQSGAPASHSMACTDAGMSAIYDTLRGDSLPGPGSKLADGHSASDVGTSGGQPDLRSASALGDPRLSDTFGLSDMWATQQPLLLDSAWVAALPDLPLNGLPAAFSNGDLFA